MAFQVAPDFQKLSITKLTEALLYAYYYLRNLPKEALLFYNRQVQLACVQSKTIQKGSPELLYLFVSSCKFCKIQENACSTYKILEVCCVEDTLMMNFEL